MNHGLMTKGKQGAFDDEYTKTFKNDYDLESLANKIKRGE